MSGNQDISQPLLSEDEGRDVRHEPHQMYYGFSQASDRSDPPGWPGDRQQGYSVSPTVGHDLHSLEQGLPVKERTTKPLRSTKRASNGPKRARRLAWICIDDEGKRTMLQADKRSLIANAGLHIPLRDMRLLDFNLVQADSTILVRDNAIIVSLEHVRIIVTAERAYIPREGAEHNPLAARFVDVLDEAVVEWARQRDEFLRQEEEAASWGGTGTGMSGKRASLDLPRENDEVSSVSTMRHELQPLPFELVVLEAALKEVLASARIQAKELEGVALPALDALTKLVSSGSLERVRKVKTRLQRLSLRCEAVRDELQRFLQDDDDMARMCLSRRKEVEEMEEAARAAAAAGEGIGGGRDTNTTPSFVPSSSLHRRSGNLGRLSSIASAGLGSPPRSATSALPSREAFMAHETAAAAAAAALEEDADAEAQQEVENLLESYYMEADGLYDKLVSIEEYIKDTEEYINIELDHSRNRLIRMEIVLSVASFAIMPFNLLAGILGENLVIPEQITGSVSHFYGVNAVAAAVCMFTFYSIILYMRYTKLI